MTTVTNRGVPRPQLRARIVEAALTLFRREPYDAVNVERICREAQVSKGAFFIFFASKAEVLDDYGQALAAAARAPLTTADPARPLSGLAAAFAAAEAKLRQDDLLAAAYCRLRACDGGFDILAGPLTDFVSACQAAGGLDADADAFAAGRMLSRLWLAEAVGWTAEGRPGTLTDRLAPQVRLLVAGLAG